MVYCPVQISREYTIGSEALCYVASLRRVGELLGLDNYLPEVVLQRFFRKHPACERSGVTWQNLTKLMEQCNSFQKKFKKSESSLGVGDLVRIWFVPRFLATWIWLRSELSLVFTYVGSVQLQRVTCL
jgi:hypothetical protein